jgi:large subunit ribosomal protein L2
MKSDLIQYKTTRTSRGVVLVNKKKLWRGPREKILCHAIKKTGGRNHRGKITCRHMGGGARRIYRQVDFFRKKTGIATVERIEYDPNRTAFIALIVYEDNTKSYIIATENMKIGSKIDLSQGSTVLSSCSELSYIPLGTKIHNIELESGRGAQLVRAAGTFATLEGKEGGVAILRVPSGNTLKVSLKCKASIGIVSNSNHMNEVLGKAGRNRQRGWRPEVRGVAMNPVDHHNGGRTHGGKIFTNPTGRIRKGQKTVRKKKMRIKV